MTPHVTPATLTDVLNVAACLAPADRAEVHAATGLDPANALKESYDVSDHCWAIKDGAGVTQGIFGLSIIDGQTACPWMLRTPDLPLIAKTFMREVPLYIQLMHAIRPTLINYVDLRNVTSIRWLRHLGFKFTRIIPKYGAAGLPFVEFIRHV